jgi:hypothetical protein
MGFYGSCFCGSCSSTGFCVRVSSTGDTLLSFPLETRFRDSFRIPVSGWGNVSTSALDDLILGWDAAVSNRVSFPMRPLWATRKGGGFVHTGLLSPRGDFAFSSLSFRRGGSVIPGCLIAVPNSVFLFSYALVSWGLLSKTSSNFRASMRWSFGVAPLMFFPREIRWV